MGVSAWPLVNAPRKKGINRFIPSSFYHQISYLIITYGRQLCIFTHRISILYTYIYISDNMNNNHTDIYIYTQDMNLTYVVVLIHPHICFIGAPRLQRSPRYFWCPLAARSAVPRWCAAHWWSNLLGDRGWYLVEPRKMVGCTWENHRKTIGKWWFNGILWDLIPWLICNNLHLGEWLVDVLLMVTDWLMIVIIQLISYPVSIG